MAGRAEDEMANKNFKEIKINRVNPNDVSPIHVNDMLVGQDGKEFFLQFLEIEPPVLLDVEQLKELETVEAIIKVKLVMSPEFLDAVVKALTESLEKFKLARSADRE